MKNIIHNIIHPTTRRTSNRLPMPEPVRKGFRRYSCAVLTGAMILGLTMPAYAANDPLTVVNNLSTFIFGLIRAVGLILLGWGIVQVGLSLQSHDPSQWDGLDDYREEYNQMLLDKATNGNGIVQEKFLTVSVRKKDVDAARSFFARVEADLSAHFAALGSTCGPLNAMERLQILHRFYRRGEENEFRFSLRDSARKGHSFRDYICPDSMERHSDYLQIGERYARVLYLKDYASYIQDDFVSELTDLNRDMMLSIDMVPIPTDEAVREVENRLLGVETNITNWQRRQNSNNNFSAVVPYDMELQRKESKEFLDDLTTRDQRMIFGILTMVITADTKEQLDMDTDVVFENEFSAAFFNSAWRQFRKRNAFPTAITQNVEYLLDSVQASTMLSNSEFIVMLNQAASDREKLGRLLNISNEQMNYITNVEAGSGLIKYGSALVPFINRFPKNTKLYQLMTTRPGEGRFAGQS